jgi:Putative lumazine-binding
MPHSSVVLTQIGAAALRAALACAALAAPITSIAAQNADSAAAVQVAQTLLRAISTRDTALARTVLLPGAQLTATLNPSGASSSPQTQGDTAFYRTLPDGKEKLLERIWSPTVSLHGSVAQVSAPYDFHIDAKFSHCGTDVFTLVRAKGEWRISNIVYTVQRAGCTPSPLGPPQ